MLNRFFDPITPSIRKGRDGGERRPTGTPNSRAKIKSIIHFQPTISFVYLPKDTVDKKNLRCLEAEGLEEKKPGACIRVGLVRVVHHLHGKDGVLVDQKGRECRAPQEEETHPKVEY